MNPVRYLEVKAREHFHKAQEARKDAALEAFVSVVLGYAALKGASFVPGEVGIGFAALMGGKAALDGVCYRSEMTRSDNASDALLLHQADKREAFSREYVHTE